MGKVAVLSSSAAATGIPTSRSGAAGRLAAGLPTPRFNRYRYPCAEGGSFSGSSGFSVISRVSVDSANIGSSFTSVTTTVTILVIT